MKTMDDIKKVNESVGTGRICPIFAISACTGESIDLLRRFLAFLPMSIVRDNTNLE